MMAIGTGHKIRIRKLGVVKMICLLIMAKTKFKHVKEWS